MIDVKLVGIKLVYISIFSGLDLNYLLYKKI